jgi:hydroxyacylglutathione hydrolase
MFCCTSRQSLLPFTKLTALFPARLGFVLWAGLLACQSLMAQPDLASIDWLHGEADCEAARAAPDYVEWQQVTYTANTFIFRQNKCSNYEAPFVYLFVGEDKSLLIDTGATEAGGPMLLELVRDITGTPLVAAHSHGHGDHTAGDEAFAKAEAVELVGTGAEAVQVYFGFSSWPNQAATLDLGNRTLELLPIPGHTVDDVAYYDPATNLLVTGDTLYPGRLYVRDWSGYQASIDRLHKWIADKDVAYVLGTHIEMTAEPDVDYPIETTYQPNEHPLTLTTEDIARLREAVTSRAEAERVYLGGFIIWPL